MANKIELAGMKFSEEDPIPPDSNPFDYDFYNMGERIGKNVTVMYSNHSDKAMSYLIIINTKTGRRVRVEF